MAVARNDLGRAVRKRGIEGQVTTIRHFGIRCIVCREVAFDFKSGTIGKLTVMTIPYPMGGFIVTAAHNPLRKSNTHKLKNYLRLKTLNETQIQCKVEVTLQKLVNHMSVTRNSAVLPETP